MSDQILPPSTHLHFLPRWPGKKRQSVICHRGKADSVCERCGAPFHGRCHYTHTVGEAEWARLQAALDETSAQEVTGIVTFAPTDGLIFEIGTRDECPADEVINHTIMLCSGCRS